MTRQLIAEQWNSYANQVLPKDAGHIQKAETRRAFYAGAWAFFATTMANLDPDSEPTPADEALLAAAVEELQKFNEDVKKGLA